MRRSLFGTLLVVAGTLLLVWTATATPTATHADDYDVPVLAMAHTLRTGATGRTARDANPFNPFVPVAKFGVGNAEQGDTVQYRIRVANYEREARHFTVADTVPSQLAYVPGSATGGLAYDEAGRTLLWSGLVEEAALDYVVEESAASLPYLDLANYGVANLCDLFATVIEDDEGNEVAFVDCDNQTVTINLGKNGYSTNIYGHEWYGVTLSSNGHVTFGHSGSAPAANRWLPDPAPPGQIIAPLWYDSDMSYFPEAGPLRGRWHVAILTDFIDGERDALYVQWHDSAARNAAALSSRFGVVVALNTADRAGEAATLYGVYDNVSDPDAMVANGYSIGIEDWGGRRGFTYAYAPGPGDDHPPRGYPPFSGTVIAFRPVLFSPDNAYERVFTYEAVVTGSVPEIIVNTARADTDSPDAPYQRNWDTHYGQVQLLTYLPLTLGGVDE